MTVQWTLLIALFCIIGFLVGWVIRAEKEKRTLSDLQARFEKEKEGLQKKLSQLETEKAKLETRLEESERARGALPDIFRTIADRVLKESSEHFLTIARDRVGNEFEYRQRKIEDLLEPIKKTLSQIEHNLTRSQAGQESLKEITQRLASALSNPAVRGRWGEIQLRNVIESAGMQEFCDFWEQTSLQDNDGKRRPDVKIRLPGGRFIVVDAKAPLDAYMAASELDDEMQRRAKLEEHARQVRKHIDNLASKAYWEALKPGPEFVVLYLPGEMLFSAALQCDASLIEYGARQKVILASPTILIALLKAVAYGWREHKLAENAEEIRKLGQDLYMRLSRLTQYLTAVGSALNKSVDSYNQAIACLNSRLIPVARRFKELGVSGKEEVHELEFVSTTTAATPAGSPDTGPTGGNST